MKPLALGAAGIGAAALLGFLKWKALTGGKAWWVVGLGLVLFVVSTPAAGSNEQ